MIEIGINNVIASSAPVLALVGDAIYCVTLPEDFTHADLPALTYQTISDVDSTYELDGGAVAKASIQFDCLSQTYLDNKYLVEAIVTAVMSTEGTTLTTGQRVMAVEKLNVTDLFQTDSRIFRTMLEMRVTYSASN